MSVIARLRKAHPYLTPPFVDDDEEPRLRLLKSPTRQDRYPEDPLAPMAMPEQPVDPITRPRRIASAEEDFAPTRPLRAEPRDMLGDEEQYLSDLQAGGKPINPIVKRPGKLETGLNILSGFLQGGIPGAGVATIRRFNPGTWRNAEIGATQKRIGTETARRKEGLQEDLMRSQIGENEAQTIRASRTPVAAPPGFTLGEGQVRYDAQGNVISRGPAKAKPVATRPVTGKRVINGVAYQTEYDPETKKWAISVGDDGQPVVIDEAKPEKPTVDNKARAQGYYDLQKQAEGEAEKLRREAMSIGNPLDASGYPNEDAKARREDLLRRANQADEKSRDFHAKAIEAETEPQSQSQKPSSVKPTRDGKYHYTPAQIRAALKPGQTYEGVLQQLKARPNVVIDQ